MWLFFISVILLLISVFLFIKTYKKRQIDKQIEKDNILLEQKREILKREIQDLINSKNDKLIAEEELTQRLDRLANIIKTNNENIQNAYVEYCETLDNSYKAKEAEYDYNVHLLETSYDCVQDELLAEIGKIKQELDEIKLTRKSAQSALLKEKEIKEKLDFYCVRPSQNDLDDVQTLERIKPKLHQPRILCMLIWSTYYQKPMTALCNNVLGPVEVTGIYKITNQETDECYIGQAVDVAKRWKEHAKCGLGIDTPANNKLYKSMQEYGLHNFSFELIEKCKKEELNEKEKFYIELYQSYEYGFNSNSGIKTKVDLFKNL